MRRLPGIGKASWILDSALVFLATAYLIWPLFTVEYTDKWASIESTFIADARFLRDHWPHPRWQPLWYTGTRFDYVYPPALRYGTAGLAKLSPRISPARAYHLYIAFFYCLGIAGVYVLARTAGGSRLAAIVVAMAVATVAPSFLFIDEIRRDARASWSEPQRLGALVRYGEGPHMTAVAILGFALAFSIQALRTGGARWIAAAALACALVVSNNFYGATALAMFFSILLWSWWITHQDNRMFLRAAGVGALAWGLTAFWLTPSYIGVTLANLRFVSERGNRWSQWVFLAVAIAYMKLSERWARGRREHAYLVFLTGALIFFLLNVIGNYYLKFRIIGEPGRMLPELDLVILLAGGEFLRRLSSGVRWRIPRRALAAVLILLLFYSVRRYIRNSWNVYIADFGVKERLEYQITDWLARNMPAARSYTTGTVRFWFNAWYDLAELGGGSEQGLLNPVVQPATWRLGGDEDARYCILWMLATGVDAAIVHDEKSKEHYHDVVHPRKFDGLLPVVYDDGQGNRIYKVPRRWPSLARVVETSKLDQMPLLAEDPPKLQLQALADVLENGPDAPTETRWEGADRLHVRAGVHEGESIFVHVAYDSPWRAYSDGRPLPVRKTQLNFLRIDAPPGIHDITLEFTLPWENVAGRAISALSLAAVMAMVLYGRRPR